MNNLLKSAARKHALSNGIATAKWDTAQFEAYIAENGITERDNLKKGNDLQKIKADLDKAEAVDLEIAKEVNVVDVPKGNVENAIAELIAATQGNADLDEKRVIELINKHSKAPVVNHHVVEVKKGEKVVVRKGVHKDYAVICAHIAAGVNTAVVGPAGSGKSTIFAQIAKDLGLDYYITGAVQQESKIMGYNDANGKYVRTPFRNAYENGGLIVIEEFDGSAAKAMLAANNAVANETTDFPDGMVKRHENFICVMAGNTFGTGASRQYVGRTQLDAATLDRFCFLDVGYDEDLELVIAMAEHDAPETAAWVAEVQKFRKAVEKSGIRHVVSPRASIAGAKLLKQGLPRNVIVKSAMHKGLTSDQIKQLSR